MNPSATNKPAYLGSLEQSVQRLKDWQQELSMLLKPTAQELRIELGASSIVLKPGKIEIKAPAIEIKAAASVKIKGAIVETN